MDNDVCPSSVNNICTFDYYYSTPQINSSCTPLCCSEIKGTNYICPDGYVKCRKAEETICQNILTNCLVGQSCTTFEKGNFPGALLLDVCAPKQPEMDFNTRINCCLDAVANPIPPINSNQKAICGFNWCGISDTCSSFFSSEYCSLENPTIPNKERYNNCIQYIKNQPTNKTLIANSLLNSFRKSNDPDRNLYIYSICSDPSITTPGLCESFLIDYCGTINSRDEVQNDPNLQKVCGCHLPSKLYSNYVSIIDQACDPLCITNNAIQKLGDNCQSTICIIDPYIYNTVIEKNLNVSNVCSSNTSQCVFTQDVLNQIQNTNNIDKTCKQCSTIDQFGNISNINCPFQKGPSPGPSPTPAPPSPAPGTPISSASIIAIIVSIILILCIFGAIIYFLFIRRKS